MEKLETEFRFNGMTFHQVQDIKGLKLFFDEDESYCVITDTSNNILFKIVADCNQNLGFLKTVV